MNSELIGSFRTVETHTGGQLHESNMRPGISISTESSQSRTTISMQSSQQPWRGWDHVHLTERMSLLGPGTHPTLMNLGLPEFEVRCSPLLPSPLPQLENTIRTSLVREMGPSVPDVLCNSLENPQGVQLAESDPRVGRDTCCLPLGLPPSPYDSHSH